MHQVNCSGCGQCLRVCNPRALSKAQGGVAIDLDTCNACGHCQAVCPTREMDNPKAPYQEDIRPLSPGDAANFLRAARSVRLYKKGLVPQEELTQLLDIGRYPQTGSNTQGISYLVISGREKIEALNELYSREIERLAPNEPALAWYAAQVKRQRETGADILFRGCSQLILALADKSQANGKTNAYFSLTFVALLAPTMGIGTCWAGIFERLATYDEFSGPFLEFADVPQGKAIRGVMMVGYPDVKYLRLAERQPLELHWR